MCILSCPRVPEKAGVSSEATPVRAVYLLLDVMSIVKTEGEALEQLMDNLSFMSMEVTHAVLPLTCLLRSSISQGN